MIEQFKDIEEFPGYKVSNLGYVIDSTRTKLKEYHKKDNCGKSLYLIVYLFDETHIQRERLIKRLVAQYFLAGYTNKLVVLNKDGDYTNNSVDNLELVTRKELSQRTHAIQDKENHIRYLNKYRVVYRPDHFHHNLGKDYEGWVYEHRYVMECYLGRALKRNEIVHHKDGDIYNNDISNLEVLSRSEHAHRHMEERGYGQHFCIDCGKKISSGATRCKPCNDEYFRLKAVGRRTHPDSYEIFLETQKSSVSVVARKYGVSNTTIENWMGQYYKPKKRIKR